MLIKYKTWQKNSQSYLH